MTDDVDRCLTLADFIVLVNRRRARLGFKQKLTAEEYVELYERYSRLPSERQRLIVLEETLSDDTKKPSDRKTTECVEKKRQTREELIAELMKLPPKRRANIVKVVELVVAQKRLDKAIRDGTARPN